MIHKDNTTRTTHSMNDVRRAAVRYIDNPLRTAIATLKEPLRGMAEYHFGWVNPGGSFADPHERVLRRRAATMTLLAAGNEEKSWDCARNVAVANTLMIAAFLVHDDLVDKDQFRYGRPAVWKAFSIPAAVHLGDALFSLAFQMLHAEPPRIKGEILNRMASCVESMSTGQAAEMVIEQARSASVDEVLSVVAAKTASGASYFFSSGPLCVGASADRVQAAAEYGHEFGMAFQLKNDYENIWINALTHLEDPLSDIRQRKVTAPVAFALEQPGEGSAEIARYYSSDALPDDDELIRIRQLLEQVGAKTWIEEQIASYSHRALQMVSRITDNPCVEAQLSALVRTVIVGTDMAGLANRPPAQ